MTEPTKEQIQEFIDAAFAFDAINTSSTAQSQRFSTALNKLRKEKPARVGSMFLDGSPSRDRVIELTPKVIARLGPTAGVDINDIVNALFPVLGTESAIIEAQNIMEIIGAAAPEIDGEL